MIPPENHFQKSCGMSINKVLAFSKRVKRIIDKPKEVTTTKSLLLLNVESVRDLPTITGKSGSMHGASTVNIPATNEMMRSVMLFYFCYECCKCWASIPFFNKISLCIDLYKSVLISNSIFFLEIS